MIYSLFCVLSCSENDDEWLADLGSNKIEWALRKKWVILDCIFSKEHDEIFLIALEGIYCYDAESGVQKWKNEKIVGSESVLLFQNFLIAAGTSKPIVYFIDITTGKIIRQVDFEKYVYMIQFEDENNLFVVSDKNEYQFQLQRYNIFSDAVEHLVTLDDWPKNQIGYYNGNIILTTWGRYGGIYIIDEAEYKIKWRDVVYDRLTSYNNDFVCLQNSVYYIKDRIDNKEELVRVDIVTGELIETHLVDFPLANSWLRSNGESILIHGEPLYLFDTVTSEFTQLGDNFNTGICSVINEEYTAFVDGDAIYCYNFKDNTKRKIYDLNGMEAFRLFAHDNMIILVMTPNVNTALADNLFFYLVALNF
jgi:hypothetical protein